MAQSSSTNVVEEDVFDDACDLGQFFMNPALYMFVKIQQSCRRGRREDNESSILPKPKSSSSNWIPYQRMLYIFFLMFGWTIVFAYFYPLARNYPEIIGAYNLRNGYFVFGFCMLSWLIASLKSPGVITNGNMAEYDHYEYDHVLYHPTDTIVLKARTINKNNQDDSSHRRRLARSKFDTYSKQHIARYDHYCGWLQRPIGEYNYRHFLVFVTVHLGMCSYGAYLVGKLLLRADVMERTFRVFLLAVWVLLAAASIALTGFLAFHLHLVTTNQTTHEYNKRKKNTAAVTATTNNVSLVRDEESHAVQSQRTFARSHYYDLGIAQNILEVVFPKGSVWRAATMASGLVGMDSATKSD